MADAEQIDKPAAVPTFTDNTGHVWSLVIDWGAMRRSAAAGVDLSEVEVHLADFYRGSHLLVNALWSILREQCQSIRLTQEGFEARVTGAAVPAAADALIEALKRFFYQERAELLELAVAEVRKDFRELPDRLRKQSAA